MRYIYEDNSFKELRVDCKKCFGLCCVALYFSSSEGFPMDKDVGQPCMNLQSDFTCSVHNKLRTTGLKGCSAYDCFGAGQKVSQVTYNNYDWRQYPETAEQMFEVFLIMRQLHEMLWYLAQALILQNDNGLKEEIRSLMDSTERFTLLDANSLLALDIALHRNSVNLLLKDTSEMVRTKYFKNNDSRRTDYFGADLRNIDLRGLDLRGACLIAANLRGVDLSGVDFIGADLRDADFCGANLTNSIFLTQSQINTSKGDINTKLPRMILRPDYWVK